MDRRLRPEAKASPMARWSAIMAAFVDRDEWGVRELAEATGLPRSAVHRILHEMLRLELLAEGRSAGVFRVGPVLARTATLLADRLDVARIARPILEATTVDTGETTILALYSPERRQLFAVAAAESSKPIRYVWESLRTWSSLHVGSSGKGILAFLPEAEREAILAALPDPVPGLQPTAVASLRAELARARAAGFALSHGERFEGAAGAAAPVRDARGRVIGDVIVSWPDGPARAGRETAFAAAAVRAAAEISSHLGYMPGDHQATLASLSVDTRPTVS